MTGVCKQSQRLTSLILWNTGPGPSLPPASRWPPFAVAAAATANKRPADAVRRERRPAKAHRRGTAAADAAFAATAAAAAAETLPAVTEAHDKAHIARQDGLAAGVLRALARVVQHLHYERLSDVPNGVQSR